MSERTCSMIETGAFPRKYRPQRFKEYIGNERNKKSLLSALKNGNRPQFLLFKGPSGTGKTSMARLVAQEYLCENRSEETGACGECLSCKSVQEYIQTGDNNGLMNIQEIDITDKTGKDEIGNILDEAEIPMYDGSWRIYLFDEFHMASRHAQNRLLKMTEEPPENVLFMLCTTNPETILDTLISRVQYEFPILKPTKDELGGLLTRVCREEGVLYENRALSLIMAKSGFEPRSALNSLEKIIRETKEVTYANAMEILEMIEERYYFGFYDLLTNPNNIDIALYVSFIGGVKKNLSFAQFVDGLLSFTLRGIYIQNGVLVDALDASEVEQYKKLFAKFDMITLSTLLSVFLDLKKSKDIEAKLLLLGYTGIPRPTYGLGGNGAEVIENLAHAANANKNTTADEQTMGSHNHKDTIIMTEDEKNQIIMNQHQAVSTDDILKMLNGNIVNTTQK